VAKAVNDEQDRAGQSAGRKGSPGMVARLWRRMRQWWRKK
jgi:hypothetical protein